ncbi:hypothetical protein [Bacillus salacetis]|uniref:hypothetical protein n=1 Tax=Bacillus salacetis TaxID=2315464 RepID=UPI00144498E1|nr:hypothetical protein [Bacillus salacetis]
MKKIEIKLGFFVHDNGEPKQNVLWILGSSMVPHSNDTCHIMIMTGMYAIIYFLFYFSG